LARTWHLVPHLVSKTWRLVKALRERFLGVAMYLCMSVVRAHRRREIPRVCLSERPILSNFELSCEVGPHEAHGTLSVE